MEKRLLSSFLLLFGGENNLEFTIGVDGSHPTALCGVRDRSGKGPTEGARICCYNGSVHDVNKPYPYKIL